MYEASSSLKITMHESELQDFMKTVQASIDRMRLEHSLSDDVQLRVDLNFSETPGSGILTCRVMIEDTDEYEIYYDCDENL